MLPMQGVWSQLRMHRLSIMCLTIGGVWKPSLRWSFILNFHFFKTTLPEDRVFNGILTSWAVVKKFLIWKMPLTMDDLLKHPLTWNFLFSSVRGFLLGSRSRLNWVALDASVACNVLSSGCHVMNRPLQALLMHSVQGGTIMCNDMQVALGQFMATLAEVAVQNF